MSDTSNPTIVRITDTLFSSFSDKVDTGFNIQGPDIHFFRCGFMKTTVYSMQSKHTTFVDCHFENCKITGNIESFVNCRFRNCDFQPLTAKEKILMGVVKFVETGGDISTGGTLLKATV